MRLERGAAEQLCVLVGLEVRQPDDHRLRIERRGDGADAFCQSAHEELARRPDIAAQRRDTRAFLGGELLGMHKGHRMHADMLADDEFHPRQADAGIRHHRGAECEVRVAEVDHDVGARQLQGACRNACDLEGNRAIIDATDLAAGAGERDMLACPQGAGCRLASHHCRHAKFARDNRGVAGAPAAIGDDTAGGLHHRLPVRAGETRHQHLAWAERLQIVGAADHAHITGADLLADRLAADQHFAFAGQCIAFELLTRAA